ncbi:MAG: ABC transporter permease [Polyangiales bacterium]
MPARSNRAWRIVGRRLLQVVPTTLGVVTLSFFLIKLAPGDAADVLVGEAGFATAETTAQLRKHLGLDVPALDQLLNYLGHLVRLNLGVSPRYNVPVSALIGERLGNTLILMLSALSIALLVGVSFGTVMASNYRRWPDKWLSGLSLLLYSTPTFWTGLIAVGVFSVRLGWFPTGGSATISGPKHGVAQLWDLLQHLTLPALTLSSFFIAFFARMTRASMLDVMGQDHVRTAIAKGLGPVTVTLRHVLRNALIPVVTVAGMNLATILSGAVVIEALYRWPGLGRLAYESLIARDFNVLLGLLLLSSLLVMLTNLIVDLIYFWLDPRVELD